MILLWKLTLPVKDKKGMVPDMAIGMLLRVWSFITIIMIVIYVIYIVLFKSCGFKHSTGLCRPEPCYSALAA